MSNDHEITDDPLTTQEVLAEFRNVVRSFSDGKAKSEAKKKAAFKPLPTPGHDELRDRYLAIAPPLVHTRLKFHQYHDGVWEPVDDSMVRNAILKTIEMAKSEHVRVTSGLLQSVLKLTEAKQAINGADFDARPDLLVCANGTLNLITRELMAWSPDHYATSRVTYAYDAEAVSPAFDRYLIYVSQILGQDVVDFLQEFIGYALTTCTRHEIMVWFIGKRGCGKSTFIDGVDAALSDRRATFSLRNLTGRFGLIHIPGKTLLTSTENTSERGLAEAEGILSAIVSGEDIHIEHKGRDEFACKPVAKILWAMNEPPILPKSESGIFRRVHIVNWPPMSKEVEIDTQLKEMIKEEGAGILNWALDGLARLNERGRFKIPPKVRASSDAYQAGNDLIGLFLGECAEICEEGRVERADLYAKFKAWCKQGAVTPIPSAPVANRAFEQRFGPTITIRGTRFWAGCRLLDALPDPVISDY